MVEVALGGRWLGGQNPGEGAVSRGMRGPGVDPHTSHLGRDPTSPRMNLSIAGRPRSAIRDSPGPGTAWPGRRRPLVAMMCNYNFAGTQWNLPLNAEDRTNGQFGICICALSPLIPRG